MRPAISLVHIHGDVRRISSCQTWATDGGYDAESDDDDCEAMQKKWIITELTNLIVNNVFTPGIFYCRLVTEIVDDMCLLYWYWRGQDFSHNSWDSLYSLESKIFPFLLDFFSRHKNSAKL